MQHAISFETYAPPQPPDPARMDVACFVGLIAQRPGAVLPGPLLADLMQVFGQDAAALSAPGGLFNRPVPVASLTEFEAIFDSDARLERRALIDGGPLAPALPGSGVPDILSVAIDGVIHDVDLSPLPLTPEDAAARIRNAGLGLEVSVQAGPGGAFLRLALPASHGPGTLAVLAYPTLGFPETRRARARALPSAMGVAVRQFFAMGGRKAVIVAMGDPAPYDCPRPVRLAALQRLMTGAAGAGDAGAAIHALTRAAPSPTAEASTRVGVAHLLGLPDVTFALLPDLPELVAPPPGLAALGASPAGPPADFAECLPAPATPGVAARSPYMAPELDAVGLALWTRCVEFTLDLLRAHVRDALLVAALPRAANDLPAIPAPRSAFLQLAEGWTRSPQSAAAPEGLAPPDAALAGHLARAALHLGTHRSAAALPMAAIHDVERRPARSGAPTCRLFADRRGVRLARDLTTSDDPAWEEGPVSRIMALLLRQSRRIGQDLAFEPAGPALQARIRGALTGLLEALRRAGALAGDGPGDSYDVRCDGSTMTQADSDAGRLIAEISFRPTAPVARITVRLPLTANAGQGGAS